MHRILLIALVVAALLPSVPASAFKRVEVGDTVKDFRLETLDGKSVALSESLGSKATVVVFWASWNPRSAEILSDLQQVYAEHAKDGLSLIAVNAEGQELEAGGLEKVRSTVEQLSLGFPVVVDRGLAVYNDYGVVALPSTVLADADGKVVELMEGYATAARRDLPERVLAALGIAAEEPATAEATLPPAEGKAYRYLQMGKLFLERGQEGRAEKAFRTAIREDPGYVPAHEALAQALEAQGKEAEAAEIRHQISSMAGK